MRRARRARVWCAMLIASLLVEGRALSQSAGYAVDRFEPASPGSDWFTTESLDLRGGFRVQAGVVADWAYAPLVVDQPGAPQTVIVDQVILHHRASLVLADRLRVGVSLPIAMYEAGEDPADANGVRPPPREQAFGDLRLGVDTRVFGTFTDRIRGAVGVQVFLPTGRRRELTSDGWVRVAPRALVAGQIDWFAWAAQLGFAFRPYDGTYAGRELGSEVFASVSAGVKVNDRFVLGPELHGAATVTRGDALSKRGLPLEALLGARARIASHFQAGSAIGTAIIHGDGAPTLRVLVMLEWAPDICVDKDGDGICANEDACPDDDGPRTTDRRTNGCPADREKKEP